MDLLQLHSQVLCTWKKFSITKPKPKHQQHKYTNNIQIHQQHTNTVKYKKAAGGNSL